MCFELYFAICSHFLSQTKQGEERDKIVSKPFFPFFSFFLRSKQTLKLIISEILNFFSGRKVTITCCHLLNQFKCKTSFNGTTIRFLHDHVGYDIFYAIFKLIYLDINYRPIQPYDLSTETTIRPLHDHLGYAILLYFDIDRYTYF